MSRPPRTPVAGVDQTADLLADITRRLAAIERLGHVHHTDGRIVGLATTTASSYTNATTAETTLTSTGGAGNAAPSLTLTLKTDHLYHAHFDGRFQSTVDADIVLVRFSEATVARKAARMRLVTTADLTVTLDWLFTPASAASQLFVVKAARPVGTGTVSFVCSTNSPAQFWIKDLGHL